MKTILCFFAVILAVQALTDEQKQKFRAIGDACIKSTGANQELIDKVRAGDHSSNDAQLPVFFDCVMTKIGVLDADGNFKLETALGFVTDEDKETVTNAINKCTKVAGAPSKINTWEYNKCYEIERPGRIAF